MNNTLEIHMSSCAMGLFTMLTLIFLIAGTVLTVKLGDEIGEWFHSAIQRVAARVPRIRMPRIPQILVPSPAFAFVITVALGYLIFLRSTDVKPCPKHPVAMRIFAPSQKSTRPAFEKDTATSVADCGCN